MEVQTNSNERPSLNFLEEIIENDTLVEVILTKKKNSNIAVLIKKLDKPDFKCSTSLCI